MPARKPKVWAMPNTESSFVSGMRMFPRTPCNSGSPPVRMLSQFGTDMVCVQYIDTMERHVWCEVFIWCTVRLQSKACGRVPGCGRGLHTLVRLGRTFHC